MSTVEERAKEARAKLDEFESFFNSRDDLSPELCMTGAKALRDLADLLEKTALDPELIVYLNKRHER